MSLFAWGKRGCGNIIMKKKVFSINQIRKYLKKQALSISQKKNVKENNIGNISRAFLACLIIMSFFFISPIVIEFSKNTSLASSDFENNSKNNLKKLLEKNDGKLDNMVNKNFLFEDILILDENPSDSIRLSAATIEELFKSTNYSLEDVRKNKLVKPISLTLLPSEIKKIENVKKRKDFFIKIILPLTIKEITILN